MLNVRSLERLERVDRTKKEGGGGGEGTGQIVWRLDKEISQRSKFLLRECLFFSSPSLFFFTSRLFHGAFRNLRYCLKSSTRPTGAGENCIVGAESLPSLFKI